jgi:hypothetical protein
MQVQIVCVWCVCVRARARACVRVRAHACVTWAVCKVFNVQIMYIYILFIIDAESETIIAIHNDYLFNHFIYGEDTEFVKVFAKVASAPAPV